jgi:hypothetical protein
LNHDEEAFAPPDTVTVPRIDDERLDPMDARVSAHFAPVKPTLARIKSTPELSCLGGFLERIDDTPFDLETIGHQAIGPYSTDRWRDALEAAKKRGVAVEEFDISRFSIRQSDLPKP